MFVENICVSKWPMESHIHDDRWTDTSRMKLLAITQDDDYPHSSYTAKYEYQTEKNHSYG